MFGLPMDIVGPVIGIGAIISFVVAGIVVLRLVPSRMTRHQLKSSGADLTGRGETLEEIQLRLGELDQLNQRVSELEERVDFAERLLAKPHETERKE